MPEAMEQGRRRIVAYAEFLRLCCVIHSLTMYKGMCKEGIKTAETASRQLIHLNLRQFVVQKKVWVDRISSIRPSVLDLVPIAEAAFEFSIGRWICYYIVLYAALTVYRLGAI